MSNILNWDLEELSRAGSRGIVGVGLEAASRTAGRCALLHADVGSRFNIEKFKESGNVCLNVGIAEQSMIDIAAGFAHEGINVFAASYAPFLIGRAFDQIKAAIGEMSLAIKLIGAPSGLSSGDLGNLSICIDDIAMLRTIPNLEIVSPADGLEAVKCIQAAMEVNRPIYIRITGGKQLTPVYSGDYSFTIGKAVLLREGERLLVISTGSVTAQVLEAVEKLSIEGESIAVLNMHTVKPLDTQALDRYLAFKTFVTVEEHSVFGGLGSAVAEYLAERRESPTLVRLGVQDKYFAANHYESLLDEAGLSAGKIYQKLKRLLIDVNMKR